MSSMRELISTWWPVALPILAIAGSQVRTETIVSSQQVQVEELKRYGVAPTNERLARIETTLVAQDRTLQRIEMKIDRDREQEKAAK